MRLQRILSEVAFSVFPSGALWLNRFSNIILMYHGVDSTGNTQFNSRHAGVKCFENHIAFLKKHFHVITLADYFNQNFKSGKINVAITFDDGYLNNFKYALPVIEKYQAPVSWFITGLNQTDTPAIWADILNIAEKLTDKAVNIDGELFEHKQGAYRSAATGQTLFDTVKKHKPGFEFKQKMVKAFMEIIDFKNRNDLSDYWRLMNDEEIRKASQSEYLEIGSHGFFHNNLGNIPLENAKDELRKSKGYLENLAQKEVVSLAYPDGSYSADVKSVAASIGFKHQLAADGFLLSADKNDPRIRDRAGIYTCGKCGNQLLDAMRRT